MYINRFFFLMGPMEISLLEEGAWIGNFTVVDGGSWKGAFIFNFFIVGSSAKLNVIK